MARAAAPTRAAASAPVTLTPVVPAGASGPARPRRNPRWIAAGLAAMCLGGLGSVGLWVQAAQSSQVVQLAHDVHRGEVIDAEDLVVATVGRAPGGSTVASRDLAQLIGQEALIDLRGGALLPPGAVGKSIVEPNQVLVGLRLAPGRIPAKGLDVGSRVLLVAVPGTSAQAEKTDATFRARVVTASSAQPDGYLVLDVAIDAGEVQKVARLAATDQLTLVREADR